jgi:NAD(P)-dependent dehydrogenase (short-subunit alcohol dehydrogenase family)
MATISFENRVVVVTGAGGGLGRSYALDLAKRGGAVVVNDLGGTVEGSNPSRAMADRVVGEIRAAGGRAIASYDSVATPDGAHRIVATAIQEFGRVDALINNAGNLRNAWFEDCREEDLASLLAVHLAGSFSVTRAAWPHMRAQGYGRVVFTTSSAGLFGNKMQCAYGAAKAGIAGLMNVLAQEGEPFGILCNALMPNAGGRMADKTVESMSAEALNEAAPYLSAIHHSMDPGFSTGLAVYLASEACTSAQCIYSSLGGRIARVFVGVTEGWQGSRERPATAEDIAAHIEQIRDLRRGIHTPRSPLNEFRIVAAQTAP